jgi:tritrans,polycis-undecaprenyl-diphosphate synthase [geranylgeranyl-diphosphate specific]
MLVHEGHDKGRQKLEDVLEWCLEIGVNMLTVYAFSTENVGRSRTEVDTLMRMFIQNFRRLGDDDRVHKHKIRVRVLGQRELLPKDLQEAIDYAENKTKDYDKYFFNLAVGYGGREEIVHGIRKLAEAVRAGKLNVEDINEKVFAEFLYTKDMPDPDLILRTSGEERISNFLLWQLAYSELYFSDIYWPGFRKIDFLRAVRSFQQRRRRFGT